MAEGTIEAGSEATAEVDTERRDAIRRNHTGTHLLHWALRRVLGDHVRQQGSLVAPDRLRFDFSHFGPLSRDERRAVEDLVNHRVISDEPVETVIASREEAEAAGAIAFFGERYGETVRVVRAGHESVELCGGTHVHALGMIGPMKIVSEGSIGANTRRIEALTGEASLAYMTELGERLEEAAELLRAQPEELGEALSRLLARQKSLEDELKARRAGELQERVAELAAAASDGLVVLRLDGLEPNELRQLALRLRDRPGMKGVGLVGLAAPGRVALVVATTASSGLDARSAASAAAKEIGGGGGGSPELATAGGREEAGIEQALSVLREQLRKGS